MSIPRAATSVQMRNRTWDQRGVFVKNKNVINKQKRGGSTKKHLFLNKSFLQKGLFTNMTCAGTMKMKKEGEGCSMVIGVNVG